MNTWLDLGCQPLRLDGQKEKILRWVVRTPGLLASLLGMGRPLRFVIPGEMVEITSRTIQKRFLLVPREEVRDAILGVLAKAQEHAPVKIHSFCWLSNHVHLLVTPKDAHQLSRFCEYLFGNVATRVGGIVDWKAKLWGQRFRSIPVTNEEGAQVRRLVYLLAQGCKEGLVASPRDWPGASSIHGLLDGSMVVHATWRNKIAASRARRRGRDVDPATFDEHLTINLSPLPCWSDLDPEEYRRRVAELVDEIEVTTAIHNASNDVKPLGARKLRARDPHHRPRVTEERAAPRCHFATKAALLEFLQLYGAFAAAYREAADQVRKGFRDVQFPVGSFPSRAPFVTDSS